MKRLLDVNRRKFVFVGKLIRCVALAIVFLVTTLSSYKAQVPEPPLPVDPRPLTQLISESEKALLADSQNPKKIVEAYLKISESHLQSSFNAIRANNESAAERELDIYNKAVAAAGKEAFALQEGRRRVSKKVEQVLYKQIKTLETIEKLFSNERERFADAALKHAKQLRVQALNEAFASGDVLKDPESEKEPSTEPHDKEEPSKDKTIKPPLARVDTFLNAQGFRRTPLFLGVPNSMLSQSSTAGLPLVIASLNSGSVSSQIPGDYLTEEEDEHVREAQAADARVKVFMRIADRRLKALAGPSAPPTDKKELKKVEEEEREWGAVPKVSRVELLHHYARAISECMAKLEDAYERNPKSPALPKALALLRDATDKHLQMLNALKPEMKSENEIGAMSGALGEAETANKGARDGLK
jgi:hypothetical protein